MRTQDQKISFISKLKFFIIQRPSFVLLIIGLFFISWNSHALQYQENEKINVEKIEKAADSLAAIYIEKKEVPGMNVAVARDGAILFLKSYGIADLEMDKEVSSSSVFGLASLTKQFTAAAIMRLVEEGEINLEDPVSKFLPEYPVNGELVTIHHLLSHTSGLQDYGLKNEELPGWYTLDLTYDEILELWGRRAALSDPGEKFDYNNWGYYLLGQIIEKVTGTPWLQYAEPELLKPIGLDNIFFSDDLRVIPGRVKGYLHMGGTLVNVPYRNIKMFSAGGGLSSTIEELIKWNHLLHSGKVVSSESLKKMTTPVSLRSGKTFGYGYGLYVNKFRGHKKIYHGGTFGFGTFLSYYPDDKISIVILSNSSRGRERAKQLEQALASIVLNIEILDKPLSASEIGMYSGVYSYQSTPTRIRELKIFAEGGKLMAQIEDSQPFLLRNQGDHKFIPSSEGITDIQFQVDNGRADGLTIHEGAWEVTPAKKIQ